MKSIAKVMGVSLIAVAAATACSKPAQASDSDECQQLGQIADAIIFERLHHNTSFEEAKGKVEAVTERAEWSEEPSRITSTTVVKMLYKVSPYVLRENGQVLTTLLVKNCLDHGGLEPFLQFYEEKNG